MKKFLLGVLGTVIAGIFVALFTKKNRCEI